MQRFIALAAFAVLFISTPTLAQQDKGPYFSGNVGLSLLADSDTTLPGIFNAEVTFDPGVRVSGALGYDFGKFRAEGEISYRLNDTDEGTIGGIPGSGPVNGDVAALSVMANGYYDIEMGNSLTPYIGVGIGFANLWADITAPNVSTLQLIDDSAIVFAYQFIAGLSFNLTNSPASITFDYRYFGTSDPNFDTGPAFIAGLPDFESEYSNHSFNIGVMYRF